MTAWLLQANPAKVYILHYLLDDYVKRNENYIEDWSVAENDEGKFSVGDRIYVWKAKANPRKGVNKAYDSWNMTKGNRAWPGGVYAIGEAVEGSGENPPTTKPNPIFQKYYISTAAWIDAFKPGEWKVKFKYVDNLVDHPIEMDLVWSQPELAGSLTKLRDYRAIVSLKLNPLDDDTLWRLCHNASSTTQIPLIRPPDHRAAQVCVSVLA